MKCYAGMGTSARGSDGVTPLWRITAPLVRDDNDKVHVDVKNILFVDSMYGSMRS